MPNKEESKERKRMVVEEVTSVEPPKKPEEETKPQILDEAAKVSSQELISNDKVQLSEEKPTETKKQISPVFWIIIPGIFLLGAILGGIVFYQRGVNRGQTETVSPTATPSSAVAPSASSSASVDLTKYTINIFNGSGIAGEAGKAKTLLTGAGFQVGPTGNAATYDYTKTIIKAKSTVGVAYLTALSTALGKSYLVDTTQTLASSSADTVQVVIGSSKATP
jgi:cytoskeletal protein RodZ